MGARVSLQRAGIRNTAGGWDFRNRPAANIERLIESLLTSGRDFQWYQSDVFADFDSTVVSGTGAVDRRARDIGPATGATASSTAGARWASGSTGWSRGKGMTTLNWSKRVVVACTITPQSATSTGVSRLLFGRNNSDGVAALDDKGIGIQIDNLALKLVVHNGSTGATVDASTTLTVGVVYTAWLVSDGAGNVTLYLNGAAVAESAGGPTGDSTAAHTVPNVHVANGADSAQQRLDLHDLRIGVEQ